MEIKKEKIIIVQIKTKQADDLREEISAAQGLLYPGDVELFGNKYPLLFQLWSALD